MTAILVAAGCLVFAASPAAYVGDDRFEKYWAPGLRLLRELSMWDGGRGLGRVREDFWPGVTLPVAGLRAIGASPALAEHMWHATLLVAGGLGMVSVLRLFRPHIGAEHLVAGLVFMFNPYSATFLVPSALFYSYVLAPWLLVAFVSGVRSNERWRWAAGFAILVFLAGDVDVPGLVYAMVPIAAMAVYLVHVERAVRWRDVVRWLTRATVLSVLVSAAALVKLRYGASAFADRLATTESPRTVNLASSWAESWRGMGFWLSYVRDQFGLARPQGQVLLVSWPVVAATFVVPCAALATVWRSRWRPRLAFLGMALVGLTLMVGSYPIGHPSPYGRLLLAGYQHIPGLSGLRNSYKAGAGLMIGLSALAGSGIVAAVSALGPRRRLRQAALVVTAGLLVSAALPFFNGRLYAADNQLGTIPAYWRHALAWIDKQPGDDRVLVLPGSTRTAYRWGWTGDDIFDALLRKPHVVDTAVPLSTPEAANLLSALNDALTRHTYRPGTLAPIARRLGIGMVLVRNDLNWARSGTARPQQLDALRQDPSLHRVATFGLPGQNVLAHGDVSLDGALERGLPPVEVYSIDHAVPSVQVRPDVPPLLVAGDGAAWPSLSQQGLLDDGRSVVYTGDLTVAGLAASLADGSPLVVTDTNRRRLTEVIGPRTRASQTLATGEDLDRPTSQLFPVRDSQSVAVFGAAARITASSVGTPAAGFQPWLRPANAFDGNEATAWEGAGLQKAVGSWIRVELRQPATISKIALVGSPSRGRRPTKATVLFSDGSSVPVDLSDGRATASFAPRRTSSLEVRVDAVVGVGIGPVGFAEISVPGLDLSELIQTPLDVANAARADRALRASLATAPLLYNFSRATGDGPQDEEVVLHRRFDVASPRAMSIQGDLEVGQATPDRLIDQLVGGPVGAWGSSRFLGAVDGSGELAVDGREDTGWLANPRAGETLTARFPAQSVDHVEVDVAASRGFSTPDDLTVTVGANSVVVPVPTIACPAKLNLGAPACVAKVQADVPTATVDHLTVQLGNVAPQGARGFEDLPVGILEVRTQGANEPLPATLSPVACVPFVLSIDGITVNLRPQGSVASLLRGEPVGFQACSGVSLDSGIHRADTSDILSVDDLQLSSAWPPPKLAGAAAPRATVIERTSTRFRLRIAADGPTVVTIGQSFDRGWSARLDGRRLKPVLPADTLSSWVVPKGGELDVVYVPQRSFTWALLTSLAGLALCGWLLFRRRRP